MVPYSSVTRFESYFSRSVRPSWILAFLALAVLPIERVLVLEVFGFTVRPYYFFATTYALLVFLFTRSVRKGPLLLLLLLVFWLFVNAMLSVEPTVSIPYALWGSMIAITSFAMYLHTSKDQSFYEFVGRTYVSTATFWSMIAIMQWALANFHRELAYSFLGPFPRVHALSYEPSFLATYLIFPLFLALTEKPPRPLATVFLVIAILLTTSRTGILAFIIGAFIWLFPKVPRYSEWRRMSFDFKWLMLLLLAFMLTPLLLFSVARNFFITYTDFLVSGLSLQDQASAVPRLRSWQEAIELFYNRPIVGVGVGAYGHAQLHRGQVLPENKPVKDYKTTNLILEILAEQGLVGLALFAFWVFLPLRVLFTRPSGFLLGGPAFAFLVLAITFPFIQTWWRPYLWIPWVLAVANAHHRR